MGSQQVGRRPKAGTVGDEGNAGKADGGEDEGAGVEHHGKGVRFTQLQPLHPGGGGIDADPKGDPLHRAGERQICAKRQQADDQGRQAVHRNGSAAAEAGEAEDRKGRQHRPQGAQSLSKRMWVLGDAKAFAHAPHWLPQRPHPEGHQQARQPHGQERRLPALQAEGSEGGFRVQAFPAIDHCRAKEQAHPGADVNAAGVDGQHRGPHLGGKVVGQHGEGGRGGAGLADAHAEAVGGQGGEAARRAGQGGHQAPEAQAYGNEALARPGVRQLAQGDAEDRVEHGEGGAVEEADVGVGDA